MLTVAALIGGALVGSLALGRRVLARRALNRLAINGQAALFKVASGERLPRGSASWPLPAARRRAQLAHAQALAHAGDGVGALSCANVLLQDPAFKGRERAAVLAVAAFAEIQAGRYAWARMVLSDPADADALGRDLDAQALRAFLAHKAGRSSDAISALSGLSHRRHGPWTGPARARDGYWLGIILWKMDRKKDARRALNRAVRAAPRSAYALRSERFLTHPRP